MIHRDENVDHLKLPEEPATIVTYFNKDGENCTQEKQAVAKSIEIFSGYDNVSCQYFVRVGSGEVLDPHETHARLNQQILKRFPFRKVTKDAWSAYSNYLKNKKRQFFTNARRLIME
jgi:hypothetical protein